VTRPTSSPTAAAVGALGTRTGSAAGASFAQRAVDGVTSWLAARTSRRGFLVRAGVVGSALAVDPTGYVLRPGTAYASVCGPGAAASAGWTVFCATINKGVNACPPGSLAAGWWKMSGASLCGGDSRYIIDCNATCSHCSTGGSRPGICAKSCQSCSCSTGPKSSCDQRRVCCNDFRYGQCNTQVRQVGAVQCRVVSCTPPWKFEKCSTSPATDQRTVDHNSSELPTRFTAITRRYIALGENGSTLGATVYGELAVKGGRAQRYQHGRISWSSATGAHETEGAVFRRYVAIDAEQGPLGFPVAAKRDVADGRGRAQRFERGWIYSGKQTGAWEVYGKITGRYDALGAAGGVLGFPLSGRTAATGDGGTFQVFQGGRIFTSSGTGTHEVLGSIDARYRVLESARGALGLPTSGATPITGTDGLQQRFEHGRITSSEEHGAYATLGRLGDRWLALGGATGVLGFPIRGMRDLEGVRGHYQRFENGRLCSSPTAGAHWMGRQIEAAYVDRGGEAGRLGFPTADEVVLDDGRLQVAFERGTLTYDPETGEVTG